MMASEPMRSICADEAYLQAMLDVEAALARAEGALGIIPADAASIITRCCSATLYAPETLGEAARKSGNLAIPLVKLLTAEVSRADKNAAGYVHWGATSQDIIDTATMLVAGAALSALLQDLDRAISGFGKQAAAHRQTRMVARTWLQHALPIPFGLKLAGYAAALERSRRQLQRLCSDALALQFGGAAGSLAALGDRGLEVAERMAADLNLPLPDAPWHSHRDRIADIASQLAILAGTCGKIARDVSLLMQTDVAEAFEPAEEGRGGSSTMPHKRNPVACATALAAATMAPSLAATILAAQVQDHERSAGPWHSEWPTLPTLFLVTSGGLAAIVDLAEGLEVDVAQMTANLDRTQGLIMAEAVTFALAQKIGKAAAHQLVETASREAIADKRHLKDVLAQDPAVGQHLSPAQLDELFSPGGYEGMAQSFIDRQLASLTTSGA
jgi:3-carboxy-cis,cis-muconate cycloisomerase